MLQWVSAFLVYDRTTFLMTLAHPSRRPITSTAHALLRRQVSRLRPCTPRLPSLLWRASFCLMSFISPYHKGLTSLVLGSSASQFPFYPTPSRSSSSRPSSYLSINPFSSSQFIGPDSSSFVSSAFTIGWFTNFASPFTDQL